VQFYGAVEGKQTAKIEKVTALVPRVEKQAEMLTTAMFFGECAESCNLFEDLFISQRQAERGS